MAINKIIIVYKKEIQPPVEDTLSFRRLYKNSLSLYNFFKKAENQHKKSWSQLQKILEKFSLPIVVHIRGEGKMPNLTKDDLVISFGGDGTFMYASHFITDSILIGINSSPQTSVGHFCKFSLPNHKKEIFLAIDYLQKNGQHNKDFFKELYRLQVFINEEAIMFPVLNDILVTEETPIITSRYLLSLNENHQEQKSSGLWISTAAGSTAAYGSAGGKPFSQFYKKQKRFAFIVRELYWSSKEKEKLKESFVYEQDLLQITSGMKEGRIYIDGNHRAYPFVIGDKLEVKFSPYPLKVLS